MYLWELMSGVMCHRRIGKGRKYFMGKMMGSDIIPCEPLCSAGAVCCQGTRPRISLVPFDWKIHLIRLIRTKTCVAVHRIHDSMTRGVESDVTHVFFHLCLCAVYSQGWMCEFVNATTLLCLPALYRWRTESSDWVQCYSWCRLFNGEVIPSHLVRNCRESACFCLYSQGRTVTPSGQKDIAHCPFNLWYMFLMTCGEMGTCVGNTTDLTQKRLPGPPGGSDPGHSSSEVTVRNTAPPRCLLGAHLKTSTASWLMGSYVKWSSLTRYILTVL